jgi:anti-sigma B factor antagonist
VQPFQLESILAGGDCAVLRITGEIDVYTAPELRECVIHLIESGTRHLIADLRPASFLDSTGLGALVGSLKRLRTHDGSLRLAISADRIMEIFRITGLNRAFALHPSVLAAMNTDEDWQRAVTGEGQGTEEWCRKHGLL